MGKKRPVVRVEKDYIFRTNGRTVTISAPTRFEAKEKFQEQFGYWPTEPINYN